MHHHPIKHWMRHTAAVPKGFLRYYMLKLLNEKPMSGSEIMSEVEKQTNGCWKPSPGSIYPLLAYLQDQDYVKKAPEQEAGIRRYALTEQGKAFLEEQTKMREEMSRRFQFFGPFGPPFGPVLSRVWSEFYPEKARELREATRQLAIAMWQLRDSIRRKYSKEAIQEATKTLEETAKRIEEITKRLKE